MKIVCDCGNTPVSSSLTPGKTLIEIGLNGTVRIGFSTFTASDVGESWVPLGCKCGRAVIRISEKVS